VERRISSSILDVSGIEDGTSVESDVLVSLLLIIDGVISLSAFDKDGDIEMISVVIPK
jgi:hypothetical protein